MRVKFTIALLFIFQIFQSVSFAYNWHLPIEKYKLSNGLTVILQEDHSSNLVTIQMWVRAGSCYEGRFLGSGITHLVEHMVFKKTAPFNRVARELQKLGGELDASTSKEYTEFNITVHSDDLEKTLELVYGVITKAEFIQKELDKEKEVVIREMDTIEDDPHRFLAQEFFNLSFQGHPYGEPTIGSKGLFQRITREDLLEYYKSQYIPRNMVLIIAGNFETNILKSKIEKLWGGITDVVSAPNYIPSNPPVKGPTRVIIQKNVSSLYIMTGFYGPSLDSRDVYPMDVLAEIAGGSKESRLVKKLRDKLGFVSYIDAWSYTPTFTGIWGVNASLVVSDWGLVLKAILKEIYRFRLDLVTEKELARAKKQIIRSYLSGLETIDGRANDLGSNEIYTRNPLFTTTYIRGIRNVTTEDIRKVAGRYFSTENFTVTVLTPSQPGLKPVSSAKQKEITGIELDNGMRVLIREDTRLPLVTIRLVALGGLLEEDIPGLSYLTSQLWLKENPDLVKDIESLGGTISAHSGNNSVGCTIQVFKEDINLALEAVKGLIKGVTTNKLELVRNIQLAETRQEDDTPYGFAFKQAKNIFFGEHPYRNSILGTQESVATIKEEDVKGFFNRYITPGNIVISIFGDVDTQYVRGVAPNILNGQGRSLTIGECHGQGPALTMAPKVNKKVIPRETEQAIIILAYPCVSIYSEDRYAIELLTQVFSGQAGRLYESVREEKALSYSVGALSIIGREPGSFMFYIATVPENVELAKELLFNEVRRLKKGGITEEELGRVRKYYLTQIQEQWESTGGLSLEVALDELYGLGWDYYKRYIGNIEKVTTDDIKDVANKYFRDDWYTLVVVGKIDE